MGPPPSLRVSVSTSRCPTEAREELDRTIGHGAEPVMSLPATDLASAMPRGLPSRNLIATELVLAFEDAFVAFAKEGYAAFARDWAALDALRDAPVRVHQGSERLDGTARGTDRDGALLVESAGRMLRVFSGDVSVRRAAS